MLAAIDAVAIQTLLQSLHDTAPVVRVQQICEKLDRMLQVLNVEPDNFAPAAVVGHQAGSNVPVPHAFTRGIEHVAQPPLAFFQPGLRALELGHIIGDYEYLFFPLTGGQWLFDGLVIGHFAGCGVG